MGKFIISAFADEYDKQFSEQLSALRKFGIHNIELRFIDGKNVADITSSEAIELKRKLDECGIAVSAIGSPIGKIALDGDMEGHLAIAEGVFANAKILGTDRVRMFSFYPPKGRSIGDCREKVVESLERLVTLAESYGITLCHENEAKIYGETAESCLDIMNHFGGRIKAVFDMGNFTLEKHDPFKAYELLREHICYFHIKDALSAGAIVPPGKGEAGIRDILSMHAQYTDEDIVITLEPHLQTFSGLNALTDSKFENPYKYETPQVAFADAVEKLKEIVGSI